MNDVHKKIAVELLAAFEPGKPFAFVLTSSGEEQPVDELAAGLKEAFALLKIEADIFDGRGAAGELSADSVRAEVGSLLEKSPATIILADCIRTSEKAMLLVSAAPNVLLLEQKKRSRTDQIELALETVRNLGAKPLGFVLQD